MEEIAQILLIEDNKMDIALTLDAFREARVPVKIQVAHNGEEALRYLFGEREFSDRYKFPLPDIVLLDLKMPGIGGIEVLKKLKATPEIKRVPVIILTSSKEEKDRVKSYDHGANSYLVKPTSFDGFLELIKKVSEYWISVNVEPPFTIM